ncbi:MAG: hypothetical protein Q9162_002364 [Coniocarpon cinnabarinum]
MVATRPQFPLFTIDGLTNLLLRPFTHPVFGIFILLTLLAFNPSTGTPAFLYAGALFIVNITCKILLFFDARFASGGRRNLDWTREVVLITGGAGGLGSALAEYYGSIRRCSTVVVDVLPATEQRCVQWEAVGCQYYQCDVGSSEAVKSLQERVEEDVGPVTILILAAGIVNSKTVLELEPKDVIRSLNVNVLGAIWCVKAFLPYMLGHSAPPYRKKEGSNGEEHDRDKGTNEAVDAQRSFGGTIVTVSSVLGYLGAAGLADYTATKASLNAFHESLKAELALSAVSHRVNLVLATPGQLDTPLFAHVPPPPLASFLGPTVTPALLAAEIIRAIDDGRDKEISLPLYAQWIGILKVLPRGMAKLLRNMVGLDAASWEGTKNRKRQEP